MIRSFGINFTSEGFIIRINVEPVHPSKLHIPFHSPPSICWVNFAGLNNCNLKFSCTLGDATIIIRLLTPNCFRYSRISSVTPIAEQVLPLPSP